MIWRETGHQQAGPFHENNLKICDLCGALNLTNNAECFVCGWHGRFETKPEVIRVAIELAERRYGRLESHLVTNARVYRYTRAVTFRSRVGGFFARVRNWLFG